MKYEIHTKIIGSKTYTQTQLIVPIKLKIILNIRLSLYYFQQYN